MTSRRWFAAAAMLLSLAIATPAAFAHSRPARARATSAASGLGCLSGRWVSKGINTDAFHGGAGTVLHISLVRGGGYAVADEDFDPSDPLYLTGLKGGYFKLTGASVGNFYYRGHGHYLFTPTKGDEDVTVFAGGRAIVGPEPVKGSNSALGDITCSSAGFTTKVTVPTEDGTATAIESWKRS